MFLSMMGWKMTYNKMCITPTHVSGIGGIWRTIKDLNFRVWKSDLGKNNYFIAGFIQGDQSFEVMCTGMFHNSEEAQAELDRAMMEMHHG